MAEPALEQSRLDAAVLARRRRLLQQVAGAGEPGRIGGGDELDAGVARLTAVAEEEHAAAEVAEHVLDQRLQRDAALGVGQHPLADRRQVLGHHLGRDGRLGKRDALRRGAVVARHRRRAHVLDQQRDAAEAHLVERLEARLAHPASVDQDAAAGAEVLDHEVVALAADPGVALAHAGERQIDVALRLAADDQVGGGDREPLDTVLGVGDQAVHRRRS